MPNSLYERIAPRFGRPALMLLDADGPTRTYFGGDPTVADAFEWPRKDGRPLTFIGQLELGELDLGDAASWLPTSGRLLFFYDMDEWPWGLDSSDVGGWRVVYDTGADATLELPHPPDHEDDHRIGRVRHLRSVPYTSIPSLERVEPEQLGITDDEEEAYFELTQERFDGNPLHQIGGFPEPVQDDEMEDDCQLAAGGVFDGDDDTRSADVARLRSEENDWRLLLQYDTDDSIGVMWGDTGMLYFWIRERDARNGNFDDVQMVLQCC